MAQNPWILNGIRATTKVDLFCSNFLISFKHFTRKILKTCFAPTVALGILATVLFGHRQLQGAAAVG